MARPSDTLAPRPSSGSTLSGKARRVANLLAKRPKGWRALLYNTAMAKARLPGPLMMPVHVSIEPTNVCNARCPVCETGNGSMERRPGMLDLAAFRTLIDNIAPHASVLMYYFMGEPFLNKHAYEMIRYARDAGIYVETCTNGDYVDAKGVVYSDLNEINFQIGGMTPETHAIYRIRSDLPTVQRNLNALIEERRKNPKIESADQRRLYRHEAQRARGRYVPPMGKGRRRRPGQCDRPVRPQCRGGARPAAD